MYQPAFYQANRPTIRLIVNPRAGLRKGKAWLRRVEVLLQQQQLNYEICVTAYAGHARELAAEAIAKRYAFVGVAGGDGSVNEVAAAFVEAAIQPHQSCLFILPVGSGNGLARALGIPLSPPKAIELIWKGRIRQIDVGIANGRYFFSNAGVGFDTLVARRFARHTTRGLFTYVWLTLSSFQKYKSKKYTLCLDNGLPQKEKAFLIAVANGNQFGYAFKIAPHAQPDDGWLEICVIRPLSWLGLARVALEALRGQLDREAKHTQFFRAQRLSIQRKKPIKWMQVDGEPIDIRDIGRVEIQVLPRILPVMVPSHTICSSTDSFTHQKLMP
ncbi:MAG: diacylglycerol kinase family lipid kinase [Thermoflavifilum sp.]|nr:diacylglycerol kinase family lipid kinase [Thermoflavifilum sp.]